MIPRILHFIWFGNTVPEYVNFSTDIFRKIYDDYKINLVMYDIKTIEMLIDGYKPKNRNDQLLQKCATSILANNQKYAKIINHCKKSKLKFIQVLSDIYRLEILYEYGGIYLDCDTFPVKKIDDNLLKNKIFIVNRHLTDTHVISDNYFIGCEQGIDLIESLYNNLCDYKIKKIIQTDPGWWKKISFIRNQKKFFDCSLKYGEVISSTSFYIDHYNALSWKNKNGHTPFSKYDNLFNGDI